MLDFFSQNLCHHKQYFVVVFDNSNVVSMNGDNNDNNEVNLKRLDMQEVINNQFVSKYTHKAKEDPENGPTVVY